MSKNEKTGYDPLHASAEEAERRIQDVSKQLFENVQKLERVNQRISYLDEHGIGTIGMNELKKAQERKTSSNKRVVS